MAIEKKDASGDSKGSTKVAAKPAKATTKKRFGKLKMPRFISSFFGYFIGAWREIRQVRWPNRRSTWKSTLAVLLFTAFWMIVVLAVDLLFQNILNSLLA